MPKKISYLLSFPSASQAVLQIFWAMEAPSKPMQRLDSVAVHKKNLEKKKIDPKPHATNQHATNGKPKPVATTEEKPPKEMKQVPNAVANEKIEKAVKKQKNDQKNDTKSDGCADKSKSELFLFCSPLDN